MNTNGNHFCCLPDQIGYNVPYDNAAVGFCGSSVPNGTMRSILDYVGDGSNPGSFEKFPCDSNPAPNASYVSVLSAIMNPAPSLNPTGLPLATGIYPNATQNTVYTKPWATISSLIGTDVATVITKQIILYTTICNGVTQTLASTGSADGIPTSHFSAKVTSGPGSGYGSSPGYGSGSGSGYGSGSGSGSNASAAASSNVAGSTSTGKPLTYTGAASAMSNSFAIAGVGAFAALVMYL